VDSLNSRLRPSRGAGDLNCSLVPRKDEVFMNLLGRAVAGDLPVYFAIVPRSLVRPFDATCNVAAHPAGEAMIKDVMRDWRAGEFHYAWVYPHEGEYVLSNDYVIWAAAERSCSDYLPCWVLGIPAVKGVLGVSGPLEPSVVRLILELPE
jgi:hypothetical protein